MKASTKILFSTIAISLLLSLFLILHIRTKISKTYDYINSNLSTEDYYLGNFNKINAHGTFVISIHKSDTNFIKIETNDDFHSQIKMEVKENELILKQESKSFLFFAKVEIHTKNVENIKLSSVSEFKNVDFLTLDNLDIEISNGTNCKINGDIININIVAYSGSKVELFGSSQNSNIEISSGSRLVAEDFMTDSCLIKVLSGSKANINVQSKLSAEAHSGSKITYIGTPLIINLIETSGSKINNKN